MDAMALYGGNDPVFWLIALALLILATGRFRRPDPLGDMALWRDRRD